MKVNMKSDAEEIEARTFALPFAGGRGRLAYAGLGGG
jgi:hypothetical protein